jgi:hypothetical protein
MQTEHRQHLHMKYIRHNTHKNQPFRYPPPPQWKHCFFWKVPRLRPFVLVRATCKWRLVCSIGGIILTGENRSTWRKPCPSTTLSTTNLKRADLASNPGPRWEAGTNRLSHGTALFGSKWPAGSFVHVRAHSHKRGKAAARLTQMDANPREGNSWEDNPGPPRSAQPSCRQTVTAVRRYSKHNKVATLADRATNVQSVLHSPLLPTTSYDKVAAPVLQETVIMRGLSIMCKNGTRDTYL